MAVKLPKVSRKTYTELRPLIQSGDIWLCSGNAPFSKLIQFATGSPWSHVGFVMRLDSIDRVVVMESVESIGVRTVPTSQYVGGRDGKSEKYPGRLFLARHNKFNANNLDGLARFGRFAVDQLGSPYDNQEIARIAWRIASRKKRDAKSNADKSFICSEYAYECYKAVGVNIKLNDKGFIAPSDFPADPNVELLYEIVL